MSKFRGTELGDSPRTMTSNRGTPLRNRYFTNIGLFSVRTVADRDRLAAYHENTTSDRTD